jgi:DNA primase
VFDSDEAGRRAADRALQTFVHEPLDVKVAAVPDGKDPCDFCMAHGGAAFREVIAGATDVMTYKWTQLQQQCAASGSMSGRQAAIKQFMEYLGQTMAERPMDPIRRGLVLNQLGGLLSLPTHEVTRLLQQYGRAATGGTPGPEADAAPTAGRSARQPQPKVTAADLAEGWVLGALLAQPELYDTVRDEMTAERFRVHQALAGHVIEYLDNAAELSLCSLAEFCSDLVQGPLVGEAIMLQEEVESRGRIAEDLVEGWRFLTDNTPATQPPAVATDQQSLAAQLDALRQKQQSSGGNVRSVGFRRGR